VYNDDDDDDDDECRFWLEILLGIWRCCRAFSYHWSLIRQRQNLITMATYLVTMATRRQLTRHVTPRGHPSWLECSTSRRCLPSSSRDWCVFQMELDQQSTGMLIWALYSFGGVAQWLGRRSLAGEHRG